MPDIGATLREARMRARIDISEIEAETKIRAKYLRALENEEWGLLPGPAYVRSFLRTYAEALDLDAKMLLEEYKLRHERPSDHDLMPIGPPRRRTGGRRNRPPRGVPRGVVVGVLVVALLGALYLLGQLGDNASDQSTPAATATSRTTTTPVPRPRRTTTLAAGTAKTKGRTGTKPRAGAARRVRLQIVPTGPGPVFACVLDAANKLRIPGVSLPPGSLSGTYRSKSFKVRLGNGNARLRVDGRLHAVADASPVGYRVTPKGVTRVDVTQTPSCVR